MRTLTVLCSIMLFSALSFGQNVFRGAPGSCSCGCGPYVPLITTPELSFATISPNPVGATNATGGLVAGATNATLSQVSGNLDAVYTLPVWYSGGGPPFISPAVNAPALPAMERMEHRERAARRHEGARREWIYFGSAEQARSPVQAASAARGLPHAARSYSNADVMRQNQQNGLVKYDNKTLKIQ
jgi:hypothetical protein